MSTGPYLSLSVLRELIRNLQLFEALYENEGIDTITSVDGRSYNLWDVQYLYAQRDVLSPRQRQAIELCLYDNVTEKDASIIMGISETNPVAMYASDGLRRIIDLATTGALPRFQLLLVDAA